MRLICPNCSAQYEIDASLIPDEGRDVQCSNCGHTWFELPPAPPALGDAPAPEATSEAEPDFEETEFSEAETASDTEPAESQEPEDEEESATLAETEASAIHETTDRPSEANEPSAAVQAVAAASEQDEDDTSDQEDPIAAAAAAGADLKRRRQMDEAALDILREEAEREMSQRRAPPAAALETQTDMPLDEVRGRNTPSRALRARMARSDSEEAAHKENEQKPDPRVQSADEGYAAPRRDLLPDIDEINSSLKARKGRREAARDPESERRQGFRAGFLLMVGLAVIMIFAYAWAPLIARAVPSMETALLVYVDSANGFRDWIDGLIGS